MRASVKAAILFAFGRAPGGVRLYRYVTRHKMGTQATHVDKLARVWPGYVRVLHEKCGVDWEGKDLWIHEGGWTVLPVIVGFLLTGKGATVTECEGGIDERYTARSLEFALRLEFAVAGAEGRKAKLRALAGLDWRRIVDELGGRVYDHANPKSLPLVAESIDVCHTGGTLEHYRPDELRQFLRESFRLLRPSGIASHVFDHRDHLYHADRRLPFLNHLRYSQSAYELRYGHRLLYHNRLSPDEIAAMFEAEGYRRVAIRRLVLPAARYVDDPAEALTGLQGIGRGELSERFVGLTDADLHTAAAHYLFRKPI